MKLVILAGGLGPDYLRRQLLNQTMVNIGSKPIIWHIMKYYYLRDK